MDSSNTKIPERREFIHRLLALSLGGPLIFNQAVFSQESPPTGKLWDSIAPSEAKELERSSWAKAVLLLRDEKKYNCAELTYMTALKQLGLPEQWIAAAGGFGGGMGQRNVCGLLTGGIMAIGAAGMKFHPQDRKAFRAFVSTRRKEYWSWWSAMAPLNCGELRTHYDGPGFERMAQRVAARLESLLTRPLPA